MSIIVRTEDLTRILLGEVPVTLVEGIDLEIQMGEFVAIMGPSGSGKSSLLYLLGLLDMPAGGKIWIDSVDTAGLDEDRLASLRLEKLGFVFQFQFLLAEFSALDNICLQMSRPDLWTQGERQSEGYISGLRPAGKPDHHRGDPRPRLRPGRRPPNIHRGRAPRTAREGCRILRGGQPPESLATPGQLPRYWAPLSYALTAGRGAHGNGLSSVSMITYRVASVSHWAKGGPNF